MTLLRRWADGVRGGLVAGGRGLGEDFRDGHRGRRGN